MLEVIRKIESIMDGVEGIMEGIIKCVLVVVEGFVSIIIFMDVVDVGVSFRRDFRKGLKEVAVCSATY